MIDNLNPHTTQDKVQMAETILTDQNEVLDAREKEQLIDLVEGLSRFSQPT